MRRQFKSHQLGAFALLLLFALANFSTGQDKAKREKLAPQGTPVMWQEPADIATRDLFLGSGGETLKPDLSNVTLIKKEKGGWSTKYRVRDGSGHEWVAKVGKEAQPETAAVRLLWGVGFFSDIDWMDHWLSQLSDRQIEDAFRAANYSSEEVRLLARAFLERIKELAELPDLRATVKSNHPGGQTSQC